jgi:cell division protein FtsB
VSTFFSRITSRVLYNALIFHYFGGMPPYGYHKQKKQHKVVRVLKNRTYTILLVSTALVMAYFLFSTKGFVSRYRISDDLQDKRDRVVALKRDMQNLARERDRLRDDKKAIEHVARETHGMIKPGEIVYRIIPAKEKKSK